MNLIGTVIKVTEQRVLKGLKQFRFKIEVQPLIVRSRSLNSRGNTLTMTAGQGLPNLFLRLMLATVKIEIKTKFGEEGKGFSTNCSNLDTHPKFITVTSISNAGTLLGRLNLLKKC